MHQDNWKGKSLVDGIPGTGSIFKFINPYDDSLWIAGFGEFCQIIGVDQQNCVILVAVAVLFFILLEIADHLMDVFGKVEGPGLDDLDGLGLLDETVHEGVRRRHGVEEANERRAGEY